jgi:predicted metalloprotease with PDZ domain
MRLHDRPRSILLTLCLSFAASAALAGDGLAAPPAPPAPAAPGSAVMPPAPNPPNADEDALRARMDAARRRMEVTAHRQEMAAQHQEMAAQRREAVLQAQMDAARRRMEVAAQQLAALSAQMDGPMMQRFVAFAGPPHGLIGVQLERSSGAEGARVREVSPGGPAERAGIRSGDVIVAVNGTDVRGKDSARRVMELLRRVKPGDPVHLSAVRGAKTRDFTVTTRPDWGEVLLARQWPDVPPPPLAPAAPPMPSIRALSAFAGPPMIIRGPVADLELARLTPGLGRYFGTDKGVLVVRAPPGGALGLQDGDVILSIDGRKPIDSSHVIRILASYDPGEKIAIEVLRAHRRISVNTSLPAESAIPERVLMTRKGALLGPGPGVSLSRDDRMP